MDTSPVSILINKNAEEPIYRQVIRTLRDQITQGTLQPGDRLPASRDLADALGVSRISIVNAYSELQAQGLLSAHAGRGTFVAGTKTANTDSGVLPSIAANPIVQSIAKFSQHPGIIAFSTGVPADEFLPVQALRQSINAVLDQEGPTAMAYEEAEGYPPLRQSICDYVASMGIRCTVEQVLITGGCQQALDLVVQSLLADGDVLLTTNPTYLGLLDTARVRRVTPIGIPVDGQGMRIDLLAEAIETYHPRLIYVAPTHHNPTGTVMPVHRRRQLLRIADEAKIPILEDGVYHELSYGDQPPPPLKALDTTGNVLHASGFSKIVLPGTRIGYLIAEGMAWDRLVRVKRAADICTPGLNQRAMHHYLQTGALVGHLDRVRRACRIRRDAALEAVRRYLPRDSHWSEPPGGMYLWVELPHDGPTAAELYITAIQHGVAFAIGAMFHTDRSGGYFLRLNFAAQPPDQIEEGMRRLGTAWHALASNYTALSGSSIL